MYDAFEIFSHVDLFRGMSQNVKFLTETSVFSVVPPWPDIHVNMHCISSISTLCLICLSNMHTDILINCLINLKPLFRASLLPTCMNILSILISYYTQKNN